MFAQVRVQQAAPDKSLVEPEPVALADSQAKWLAASFEHAFASTAPTVGLEEELILVDPGLLVPVDAIEPVLAAVQGDDRFAPELRASQAELRTPVCLTVADACRELSVARQRLLSVLGERLRLMTAEGTESGLASTRLKLTEDLPRSGIPPPFATWRDLAEFVVWARSGDSAGDLSYLWWDLRLRPEYGTLEFRVADTQLSSADTGAIAAFCQTLVASLAERRRSGQRLPLHDSHRLSENRCRALRDGLDGTLIDPDTGIVEPTRERIGRLLLELEPHADQLGCTDELAHAWTLLEENGAIRQRRVAAEHGVCGLLDYLTVAPEVRQPAASAAILGTVA